MLKGSPKLFRVAVVIGSGALALAGCAGHRPTENYARAELAIDHARQNDAATLAPSDLLLAEEKLSAARIQMNDGEYDDARRLADEALVQAQLAEARATSEIARHNAEQTRRNIEALQLEASATTSVVVDRTPSTIVVERHNRPVIVHQVASNPVVVEHVTTTAPATVVEEHVTTPATVVVDTPPKRTVVIEHSP